MCVRAWLKKEISSIGSLKEAYLFGSFVRGADSPNDIDCILVFKDISALSCQTQLRTAFRETFGLSLHIQTFHVGQRDLIETFLRRASHSERIYG